MTIRGFMTSAKAVERGTIVLIIALNILCAAGRSRAETAEIDYDPPRSTGAELWAQYVANPNAHPNIPNNSYAGYRHSESDLPEVETVANVMDFGAAADGETDDMEAFVRAIAAAKQAGGGAILAPAGAYRLSGQIRLDESNLVLRGEGAEKTFLKFDHSLEDLYGPSRSHSWRDGLIRVEPARRPRPRTITAVTEPVQRGDFTIRVADASALSPAQTVEMRWRHARAGDALFNTIAGHELMHEWPWSANRPGGTYTWPVEIEKISDNEVTLRKPLRVKILPEWGVELRTHGGRIKEAGVEGLTLIFPPHPAQPHTQDKGYNGVHFGNALHCWLRDVHMENVDVGISVERSSHVTIRDFLIRGGKNHHATTARSNSHDNLFTDFRIESRPLHGLNTEQLSSGNVWRRGVMKHGTFDSHRAMSFDLIRTDITLSNDGIPGGSEVGPYHGARCVHWNIRVTGEGPYRLEHPGFRNREYQRNQWVYQPDLHSQGALAGIQGVEMSLLRARTRWRSWYMVTGDKNCIVADHGEAPDPPDLFEAQLRLRLSGTQGKSRRDP